MKSARTLHRERIAETLARLSWQAANTPPKPKPEPAAPALDFFCSSLPRGARIGTL